jgi:hypothetical protein
MSPRPDISMTEAEIDAFLRAHSQAIVVALDPPGAPTGTLGALRYDDGNVAVALDASDGVCALLERDNRVCCVVEQYPTYYEIGSVMLHGIATRRRDDVQGVVVYDVDVVKTVSFDFAKLPRVTG